VSAQAGVCGLSLARGVHAPVGLEVADAPDAEPDGIPSLLHTAGVAIRFSLDRGDGAYRL